MRIVILFTLFGFLLVGCAVEQVDLPEPTAVGASLTPLDPDPTATPEPTALPDPTPMPAPTDPPQTDAETPEPSPTPEPEEVRLPGIELFDFMGQGPAWYTVDDDVMGGVSSSAVAIVENDLLFSGTMSLDNNGGFSSVRSQWAPVNLSRFDGVLLRVLGDGKAYRFRIRGLETGRDISYNAVFQTTPDTWELVYIRFADMVPTYFGTTVNVGELDTAAIGSFGFMLSDKQAGEFELLVDWIRVVSETELQEATRRASIN